LATQRSGALLKGELNRIEVDRAAMVDANSDDLSELSCMRMERITLDRSEGYWS
jgi:hypothetical protein